MTGANMESSKRLIEALSKALALVDGSSEIPVTSDHPRWIAANDIAITALGMLWPRPADVEKHLKELRRHARTLPDSLLALNEVAASSLNGAATPQWRRYMERFRAGDDEGARTAAFGPDQPGSELLVPALVERLKHLDEAMPFALARVAAAVAKLPKVGRKPNLVARGVALEVARYYHSVNGKAPALWTSNPPSGRYATALRKCFDALGLRADIQRPAEWALKALKDEIA